jgi:hypothetical protein
MLVEQHGFVRDAFAKPLKDVARLLWHFSEEQLYGDLKEVEDERWKLSPRVAMQLFGTEVGRELFSKWMPHVGERFWLTHFQLRRETLLKKEPNTNIVVCDVRFPNEAELIKDLGCILVKVIRPGHQPFVKPAKTEVIDEKTFVTLKKSVRRKIEMERNSIALRHKSETMMDEIKPDLVIINDGTLSDLAKQADRIITYLHSPPPIKHKRTPKAE